MKTIHPRPFPALRRAVIPFLLSDIGDFEEQSIVPFETPALGFAPDRNQAVVIGRQAFTLPFADGALMHASDLGKLVLPDAEDVLSDMFNDAHAALCMRERMFCQHASANLFHATKHVKDML